MTQDLYSCSSEMAVRYCSFMGWISINVEWCAIAWYHINSLYKQESRGKKILQTLNVHKAYVTLLSTKDTIFRTGKDVFFVLKEPCCTLSNCGDYQHVNETAVSNFRFRTLESCLHLQGQSSWWPSAVSKVKTKQYNYFNSVYSVHLVWIFIHNTSECTFNIYIYTHTANPRLT